MKITIDMIVIRTEGKIKKLYVQCRFDNINQPSLAFTESELADGSTEKELKQAIRNYLIPLNTISR